MLARHSMKRLIVILILIFAIVGACGYYLTLADIVTRLDLGQGRLILIQAKNKWETNRALEFQVRDGLNVLKADCPIEVYDASASHDWEIVFANNRSLVGILDNGLSYSPLLIMYDFSSGEGWPCGVSDQERDNLFRRLQIENPGLPKILGNPPWF